MLIKFSCFESALWLKQGSCNVQVDKENNIECALHYSHISQPGKHLLILPVQLC